jgi:two-component system, OmpR family, phosphate regulon sensor histidine kinase PhoR
MAFRISFLFFLQSLGGWTAWALWPQGSASTGALIGVVAGGLVWVLLDTARAMRVLQWLKQGHVADVALRQGFWGEVSDRVRRLVREREQQAQASEQRLQAFLAALQASPNGLILLDAQGRIEWFNQTAAAHFGLDAQRDLQQHFVNLVRDPSFATYYGSGSFVSPVVMPGRDHTLARPVRLSVHIHPYAEGRQLLLSRDVTQFEQADAMRRDFVANVSHEIRTPLTVLAGFVETLQSLPLDEAQRSRYLELMAEQSQRMETLVNDLLVLSRLEGSPLPSEVEWVAVPRLLQLVEHEARALSMVLGQTNHSGHQLSFEVDAQLSLTGAHNELQSAMSNLVNNAIRYTPNGGELRVQWLLDDHGRAEFSVTDTGPGIAPEHIPRLTERFYRVDRSRSRDTGGTGLGLAIVKHVAQRHGAELKIESTLGKGSRFVLLFPAARVRTRQGD